MATNTTPNYEIPTEMRDFAEKSVEQARKALELTQEDAAERIGDELSRLLERPIDDRSERVLGLRVHLTSAGTAGVSVTTGSPADR